MRLELKTSICQAITLATPPTLATQICPVKVYFIPIPYQKPYGEQFLTLQM